MGKSSWQEVEPGGLPPGPHKKLKLYADEHVPVELAEALRQDKLPVLHVNYDSGRQGHPDENVFQRARKLRRTILTFDQDFWDDRAHPLHITTGILIVAVPPDDDGRVVRALAQFYQVARLGPVWRSRPSTR